MITEALKLLNRDVGKTSWLLNGCNNLPINYGSLNFTEVITFIKNITWIGIVCGDVFKAYYADLSQMQTQYGRSFHGNIQHWQY